MGPADGIEALAAELEGRGVRRDEETLARYSRDRSPFRLRPAAVLAPRRAEDVAAAVAAAAACGVPVTPRAGGSSVAGQCLGDGLVLDVAGLRGIEPAADGSAWCAAGETLDSVNAALAGHGRAIGPDAISSRWARVGGLVATNACGSRSLVHGRFADCLLEVESVLADGSLVTLAGDDVPGQLAAGLAAARDGLHAELERWPSQPRSFGGYLLPALAASPGALPLVAGSEGTLCVITRARLATVELRAPATLEVSGFGSLRGALDAAPELAAAGASAVEVLDRRLVALARRAGLDALPAPSAAALVVEWPSPRRRRERPPGSSAEPVTLDGADAALAWQLRGRAVELAGGPGMAPLSCFEDPATAPELVGRFCDALLGALERFGFELLVYGHAGAGCLHVRPLADPRDPSLAGRLLAATEVVCDLAREHGGALTGEHGWGLARSHLAPRALGPALYSRFEAVKRAFDPRGTLNPGLIVGGEDPRRHLRP